MAGYLANLLPCHKGENGLLSTQERGSHPSTDLWKQRKAICLPLVSLLSPSNAYLQMWSMALAAVKTAEARGQKQCSHVFFKLPSLLRRPPWLTWGTEHLREVCLQRAPEAKAPHTSQKHDEGKRRYLSFLPRKVLSFESSKAKKKGGLLLIRTIGRHSAGVCVKRTNV